MGKRKKDAGQKDRCRKSDDIEMVQPALECKNNL